MRLRGAWRWPLFATAGFLSAAFALFAGAANLPWIEAADCALAALAGTRPQIVSFAAADSLHPGTVLLLYALGLAVRVFLIAYWAASLVRRSAERNELRKLRRQLAVRMRPETAEMPELPRPIHWN